MKDASHEKALNNRTAAGELWVFLKFSLMAVAGFALSSPLVVLGGYGLDAVISQQTGCSIVTLQAAVTGWSPAAQVGALLGRWLFGFAFIPVSMWWVMSYHMLFTGCDERRHNMVRASIKYCTAILLTLAVLIPIYSQGICLAA